MKIRVHKGQLRLPGYESGFLALPHEYVRNAFAKISFTSYQSRLFWTLVGLSWSWNQRGCYCSYRKLAAAAGLDLRNTARIAKELEARMMLHTRKGKGGTYWELNPDYMMWLAEERPNLLSGETVKDWKGVVSGDNTSDNKVLSNQTTPGVVSRDNISDEERARVLEHIREFRRKMNWA